MKFRDKVRVRQRLKKGTSRSKRLKIRAMEQMAEAMLNTPETRAAVDKVSLDSILYGTGAASVTWDNDLGVQIGALDPDLYRTWQGVPLKELYK